MEFRLIVRADLPFNDGPVRRLGDRAESAQKDRLARTARAGDDHRLLGIVSTGSGQEEFELGNLRLAAEEPRLGDGPPAASGTRINSGSTG